MNDVIDTDAVAAIGAIGQPVRRKEDQRLLTGKGRFTDDFNLLGQICAVMVRSPHPRLCKHESFYDPNRRDTSADNAWHGARQAREQGGLPEEDLIA